MIADVNFSTEGLVIIGVLLTALVGAISVMWKTQQDNYNARLAEKDANYAVQLADKDKQLLEKDKEINNWKQVGAEAVVNLRKAANNKREREGVAPIRELVDVVPEHSSPATEKELKTAELATVRAALVAATLDLGLPARGVEGEVSVSNLPLLKSSDLEIKDKAAVAAEMTKQVSEELDIKAKEQ